MYFDGFGHYQIADKRNSDDIETVWNKKWTGAGIRKMFKRKIQGLRANYQIILGRTI